MNPKFDRQARLKEVGSRGQDRLERARVVLSGASCGIVTGQPEGDRDVLARPAIAEEVRAGNGDFSIDLEIWLAKEYLQRAGLAEVRVGRPEGDAGEFVPPRQGGNESSYRVEDLAPFAHAGSFETDVARTLAAGAWRALRQVRSLLELEE